MSKYNLTDILEQYRIGSGWTTDFDYDGMLKAGLAIKEDTPLEIMKDIVEDFTDVNYHREAAHLYDAIEAIEANDGDYDAGEDKIKDFHAEIRKTQEEQGMDVSDDLGTFMASKMGQMEAEEEKKLPMDEIAGYDRKGNKQQDTDGSDAAKFKMAARDVKEGRYASIDREVADRIEGFLNIPMKKKLLDAWEDLFYDLVDDEPFDMEDVLAHLSNEMGKVIDGNQMAGDRLAGISENGEAEDFTNEIEEDTAMSGAVADELEAGALGDRVEEALPKFKGVPPMKDIVKALKDDAKATDSEIKQFMASVKKAGDEFDDVDDYVEDFKNYVADKSLQEHFGRFMKDYQ